MGYRPPSTVHKLDFSDTEHPGLEVATRGTPLGVLLDIIESGAAAQAEDDASGLRDMYVLFAGVLESWNVEDAFGDPLPATLEGVLSLDTVFAGQLLTAWTASMTAPPKKET